MDPRDPDNDRIRRLDPNAARRQPRKEGPRGRPAAQVPPRTPTGPLRAVPPPSAAPPVDGALAQDAPFAIRLDPNSPPGEFNFIVPQAAAPVSPQVGLIAETDGMIPPQLYKAVDEVLGFIYGLDQQFENQGRRPKR